MYRLKSDSLMHYIKPLYRRRENKSPIPKFVVEVWRQVTSHIKFNLPHSTPWMVDWLAATLVRVCKWKLAVGDKLPGGVLCYLALSPHVRMMTTPHRTCYPSMVSSLAIPLACLHAIRCAMVSNSLIVFIFGPNIA